MKLQKVISGGQTGVDRAALDAARELGIEIGGWCPKGRRAEDGFIDSRYPLKETQEAGYGMRTVVNVREADATLILVSGAVRTPGTAKTIRTAERLGKPYLVLDLTEVPQPMLVTQCRAWLTAAEVKALNVAGPRESRAPGIYARAKEFLLEVLRP